MYFSVAVTSNPKFASIAEKFTTGRRFNFPNWRSFVRCHSQSTGANSPRFNSPSPSRSKRATMKNTSFGILCPRPCPLAYLSTRAPSIPSVEMNSSKLTWASPSVSKKSSSFRVQRLRRSIPTTAHSSSRSIVPDLSMSNFTNCFRIFFSILDFTTACSKRLKTGRLGMCLRTNAMKPAMRPRGASTAR